MNDRHGIALFPGIDGLRSVRYTLAAGIEPGVAWLEIAPQATILAAGGTLVLGDGVTQLAFPDCRLDRATVVLDAQGFIVRLALLDRRWKWRFGRISGRYNLRAEPTTDRRGVGASDGDDAAPRLIPGTERTPRELCRLCLEALGERSYDLSQLPEEPRPEIDWHDALPAEALAALAARLGMRVVLRLDNRVALVRQGGGLPLPRGDSVIELCGAIDPPERPDALVVIGGASRWQVDLPLEAVGLEPDGRLEPLESLSYRPGDDWSQVDLDQCLEIADDEARQAARSSVYRWYRVASTFATAFPSPPPVRLERLEQLLPLGQELLTNVEQAGTSRARRGAVFGIWHDPRRTADYVTTGGNSASTLLPLEQADAATWLDPGSYTLDARRGLVCFKQPVFRVQREPSEGALIGYRRLPAQLRLRTTVELRDPVEGQPLRFERLRPLTGARFETPPRYLLEPELIAEHVVRYDADYRVRSVDDNRAELERQAAAILDRVEAEYRTPAPETIGYAGLLPLEPDGAIHEVAWSVDLAGTTTRASRLVDLEPLSEPPRKPPRRGQPRSVGRWKRRRSSPRG